MKRLFQRMILHLKGLGLLFWVPLVAVDLLLPVVAVLSYHSSNWQDEMTTHILSSSLILIPLFSSWWGLFILQNYVEGKGNEILYVCKNKIKTPDTLLPFLLFFLTVILQYAFYIRLLPDLKYEPLRLFCICIFFVGLTQFLMFFSKSTAITFMFLIGYTILNVFADATGGEQAFPIYFSIRLFSMEMFKSTCLPMFFGGIILLILASLLNKRIRKFN